MVETVLLPLNGAPSATLDAHCHLQDSAFDIAQERDDYLNQAKRQGIVCFWSDSCVESDWAKLERLVDRYGQSIIRPGFGIHPWFADQTSDGWESRLEAQLERNPSAAVAEIGLDRPRARQIPWDVQIPAFQTQLILANRLQRPATIHCVRAWDVLAPILKQVQPQIPIVFHAFRGSRELAEQLMNLCGCWFSFPFSAFLKEGQGDLDAYRYLSQLRPDRILHESDAPFRQKRRDF